MDTVDTAESLEKIGETREVTFVILKPPKTKEWNSMALIILNLPNYHIWNMFILSTVLLTFAIGNLKIAFLKDIYISTTVIYLIYFFCDLIYLIDIILRFCHNYWKQLRLKITVRRTHPVVLAIDVISLLPQEIILAQIWEKTRTLVAVCRSFTFLRMYRMGVMRDVMKTVQRRRLAWVVFQYVIVVAVLTHFATCFWVKQGCKSPRCEKKFGKTWTISLKNTYIEPETIPEWYLVSFYGVFGFFANLGLGDIFPTLESEAWLIIAMMYIGFLLTKIALPGVLIVLLLNVDEHKTKFTAKVKFVTQYLNVTKTSKAIIKEVENYYELLWKNKRGIKEASYFSTFPVSLQMEITYDINFAHLQQSLLFKNQPEYFLRHVSLLMKNIILQRGEVLFHQDVVKTHMICISVGILEVLSDEDEQSPIISFKKGTILGESSLYMNLPSKATVRAATYAELQTISKLDFIKTMMSYRDISRELRENLFLRINVADDEQKGTDKGRVTMNLLVSQAEEFKPIKLLKERLSKEKRGTFNTKCYCNDESSSSLITASQIDPTKFNDSYLPLYKLSENISAMEPARIFLTYKYPWILDPNSSFAYYLDRAILVSQIVLLGLLTYYICFHRNFPKAVAIYVVIADILYAGNVYVLCTTAVVIKDKVIKKFTKIMSYRMQFLSFYADVISIFPLQIFTYTLSPNKKATRLYTVLYLNKMLRVWRIIHFFKQQENDVYVNLFAVKFVKILFYLIIIAIWTACILYLEACYHEVCQNLSWFYARLKESIAIQSTINDYDKPFGISLYFASNIVFLVGMGDITPENLTEITLVTLITLIGIFVFAYIIADLCALVAGLNRPLREYRETIQSLEKFLKHSHLSRDLNKRVLNYFYLSWYYDGSVGRNELFQTAPHYLKLKIQDAEMKDSVSRASLFKYLDIDFQMVIIKNAKVIILPDNEAVYYSGDISREMYILEKGYCRILQGNGCYVRSASPGDQLGAIEMIYGLPKQYTIFTSTNCKLIAIDYKTYMQAMNMFPSILEETKVIMTSPEFLEQVTLVEKERQRYTKMAKEKVCKIKWWQRYPSFLKDSFIFTLRDCKRSKGADPYWAPFKTMGKLKFLGFLLLPLTINPHGPFFLIWCIFRIICINFIGLILPPYVATVPYLNYLLYPTIIAIVTVYVDMYILLHVAYYNEDGILITHPKHTAKYYLTHSFIVDLISAFPVQLFIKWFNPEHDESHDPIMHMVYPHFMHCSWMFNLPLQLHRMLGLIRYLESNISLNSDIVRSLKLFTPIIIIMNCISSLAFNYECDYKFYNFKKRDPISEVTITLENKTQYYGYLECENGSWLSTSQFQNETSPVTIYLVAYYWVLSTMSVAGYGDIFSHGQETVYLMIMAIFFGLLLYSMFCANWAAARAQYFSGMFKYDRMVRELLDFLKKNKASREFLYKVRKYYVYLWKRTSGINAQELCRTLNTALAEDTVLALYERTLREVPLFENVERSFIQVIAKHLSEEYYMKGDTVVRCYDVQSNIYIIHRGKVEVLSSYSEMIACMGGGGLFGNIHQVNAGISSVSVVASRTLDVLVISSQILYSVLKDYPRIKRNMDNILKNAKDFIIPTTILEDEYVSDYDLSSESSSDEESRALDRRRSTISSKMSESTASGTSVGISEYWRETAIQTFKPILYIFLPHKWFKFAIDPDHCIYILDSIVVLFVSILNCFAIPYEFVTQDCSGLKTGIQLGLEVVFYIRIFLKLHKAYMNRTGIYVVKNKKILHKYWRNKTMVFWDVAPNIPIELITIAIRPHRILYTSLRFVHLLRIKYIIDFFAINENSLFAKRIVLFIFKILLITSITIHIFTCILLVESCPFDHCRPRTWIPNEGGTKKTPFKKYFFALYVVLTISTATGTGDVSPISTTEVVLFIAFTILGRTMLAIIIADVMSCVNLNISYLASYENKVFAVIEYLKNLNLSDHQMDKCWAYVKLLWSEEKGKHMPDLLTTCPYVLKCDLMTELFGAYLRNSYLFKNINHALLTQIAARLRREVYFDGNYIVQHGDANENMYFIYSGQVSVLTVHPNLTETQHETLSSQEMFGGITGLFRGLPFRFSYRAKNKVEVLSLNLCSWEDLMKYFPSDKNVIYARAHALYKYN